MLIKNPELEKMITGAPELPGCYIYRDKNSVVLYVGKAINLRKRVKSYFQRYEDQTVRIQNMVRKISTVEFVVADNDLEAFILETNLIRKYKPKYNVDKKDDKSYSWVMVDGNEDFPRIQLVRKRSIKKAKYFGPYARLVPAKRTLDALRKIFPYRTCNRVIEYRKDKDGKLALFSSNSKPCLYWHLGLCDAPCAGKINKVDYKTNIKKIELFFTDKKKDLIAGLKKDMFDAASAKDFEKAAVLRDKVADLTYLATQVDIEESTDEYKFRQVKLERQNKALEELVGALNKIGMKLQIHKGFKIECYDISNIQGAYAVGSMIVFVDGKPDKSKYRKFRIKTKGTPDDFAMHKEVQIRRINKYLAKTEDESFNTLPDLIIIDGGKGQLSSASKVQKELGVEIPIAGLAKKLEEIFVIDMAKNDIEFLKTTLPRNSQAKYLIQRIRDESHRFAITYHKRLREKEEKLSQLDKVPGVGEAIKKKLIKAFGSIDGILKASENDIMPIVKNRKTIEFIKKIDV